MSVVFKDTVKAKEFYKAFWTDLINELGSQIDISLLFIVKDPDFMMYIDSNGIKIDDEIGDAKADIQFTLSVDTAHQFWLKELSLPKALATRRVRTKGSLPKVMKLLPLLKPAYARYREYCEKYNLPQKI
ncbi:MAG: SCP2 sterol-binding domain-containing protein [Deltaproteobacteria bacterium]|nr:SCP2 sterol-binding domain-containing protein [Deltaproteobacteria bacterium]